MRIQSLRISNFKSIRELEIADIENALILVGKNNTGKTVVLDAIRAVVGDYKVKDTDFNLQKQNVEIELQLELTRADLELFHAHGIVSRYKSKSHFDYLWCGWYVCCRA